MKRLLKNKLFFFFLIYGESFVIALQANQLLIKMTMTFWLMFLQDIFTCLYYMSLILINK